MNEKPGKIKHKITTRCLGAAVKPSQPYRSLIRRTVCTTLTAETADLPCVVNVLITDDEGIRGFNRKYRDIDAATDVLSFPMQEFEQAGWRGITEPDIDLDTQTLPLGDIVMSVNTIERNAHKYNRTFEQETVYMIIHSTLHLLGYDHCDKMRRREEKLMRGTELQND